MAHKGIIHDWDYRTEGVVNGVGATNTASGAALLLLSDTIHMVIGAILIATGLFLFYWAATRHRRWDWDDLVAYQRKLGWPHDHQEPSGGDKTVPHDDRPDDRPDQAR